MFLRLTALDYSSQVLHDAFFKYQTKPKLTHHGDLYYEGKEFEVQIAIVIVHQTYALSCLAFHANFDHSQHCSYISSILGIAMAVFLLLSHMTELG